MFTGEEGSPSLFILQKLLFGQRTFSRYACVVTVLRGRTRLTDWTDSKTRPAPFFSPDDLQHGPSSGRCGSSVTSELSRRSASRQRTKSSGQCHRRRVPNANQLHVKRVARQRQEGRQGSSLSVSRRFNFDTKIKDKGSCGVRRPFCRMCWFSDTKSIKAARMKKCRYLLLKTVYFLLVFLGFFCSLFVTLATYFTSETYLKGCGWRVRWVDRRKDCKFFF